MIRQFFKGDEIALFRVFFSAVHEVASRDYTTEQVNAWAPADTDPQLWAARMRDLHPFVVEIDKQIVGYADLQPDGYIDHFYVSGACPRQGIGTLLMNRIHEEARLLGLKELTSDVSKTAEPLCARDFRSLSGKVRSCAASCCKMLSCVKISTFKPLTLTERSPFFAT